jgi:hypothetical protein
MVADLFAMDGDASRRIILYDTPCYAISACSMLNRLRQSYTVDSYVIPRMYNIDIHSRV